MELHLTGKRALVTGGSRGIGKAIAHALLCEGVRVVIASRDDAALQQAAHDLATNTGGDIYGLTVDTRDDSSVEHMVTDALQQLGGLDIVVNAAARPGSAATQTSHEFPPPDAMLDDLNTKVLGYYRIARATAPHLIANGWGRIINISGLAARKTGSISGSIRNVAVAALTKGLADELGPMGINVTVVHPGSTRTERTANLVAEKAAAENISEAEAETLLHGGALIGRIVEAEEIAALVVFLASPLSAAINGDAIAAGGGIAGAIHY